MTCTKKYALTEGPKRGGKELMWASRSAPPVIFCLLRAWYPIKEKRTFILSVLNRSSCINLEIYHVFHLKNACISSTSMELSPWTLRFSEPFSFAKAFCTVFRLWITKTRRCPVLIGCLRQWCSAIQPEGTPGVTRSVVDKLRSSTPASLGLPTWRGYQADFNGRCVVFKMYTGVYHRFIVSMGTRRAAWRRSQGCDCVARELKWKINLCPWILRWICGRTF